MTLTTKNPTPIATKAETSRFLKKYLLKKFGINAKISQKSYTGGSSLRISYTGGANPKIIEAAVSDSEFGSFDGMNDIYNYDGADAFVLDGKRLAQFKYTFVERELSDDLLFRVAQFLCRNATYSDIHQCVTREDYERRFDKHQGGYDWSWQQYMRNSLNEINLVTDDFDGIEIVDTFSPSPWKIGFLYTYKGKIYSTLDAPE